VIKNFFKIGNSWGIFIPKPLLEILKINPDLDKIDLQIENYVLKLKRGDKTATRGLTNSGNGWALIIPKILLEILKINPEMDKVELQIENNILKISKYE
jgi:antitoxin component of MazEF toxin-antitoxin module